MAEDSSVLAQPAQAEAAQLAAGDVTSPARGVTSAAHAPASAVKLDVVGRPAASEPDLLIALGGRNEADGHSPSIRRGPRLGSARLPAGAPRVSVVIPTLNEEENLPHVFSRLPDGLHELILVDGHSTDGTVTMARRLRPDVRVITQSRRGKGNALAEGFAACTGDIIVALDADGSTDAAEIPRFVAALCNGADFVKGSRFAQGGASLDITFIRSLGNRALNSVVNALYRTHYSDLCYGYNAFWVRCLPYMRVDCEGFEVETLINVRIAKAGLVVHEVPSNELPRIHGESNLKAFRDGSRVLRTIATERLSTAAPRSILPRFAHRALAK